MSRSLRNDVRDVLARVRSAVAGAPGWLGGVAAGVQAAVLCVLVVMTPAIAAIAAAPTADGSTSVDWAGAAAVAAKMLLLAHTVPFESDAATVTLVPLGLTLVCALIVMAVSQRFATKSWGSWLMAVLAYAACIGVVAALVAGPSGGGEGVLRATGVAALLAAPSAAAGIWRAHGAQLSWVAGIPHAVRAGMRLSVGSVALAVTVAASAGVVSAVLGSGSIAEAATSLNVDPVGGVALAFAQTIYVPVMVVWMLAWMTGLGFSVGQDNVFAPSVVATDTLPTIPLLGALPQAQGGLLVWVPLIVVAVGALAWTRMRRRVRTGAHAMAVAATAIAMTVVSVAALTWAATGAIGPGRLATVGSEPWSVGVVAAALLAAGYGTAAVAQLALKLIKKQWAALTGPSSPHAVLADASRELKVTGPQPRATSAASREA